MVLHKRHMPIIIEMGRKRKKLGPTDNGSEVRSKEKKTLLLRAAEASTLNQMLPKASHYISQAHLV